jgi:voltage-gated potassium channel
MVQFGKPDHRGSTTGTLDCGDTTMTDQAIAGSAASALRVRVFQHLHQGGAANGRVSAANIMIMGLIIISVAALAAETTPLGLAYPAHFHALELFSVMVFTVEYVLRLWSAAEAPRYGGGWRGRVRYAVTPMAIVDLLAILPFFLPAQALDLRSLRLFRLFRILRLAKLARYSAATEVLGDVLREKRAELSVLLAFVLVLVISSGSVMYYLERDAQPEAFASIPHAAWWSVVTLTTIGYGDTVPVTALGKLVGAIVALFGVGIVALPAGMLGAAFAGALSKKRLGTSACAHCGRLD